MNKRYTIFFIHIFSILFIFSAYLYAQSPEGNYLVGDRKCSIKLAYEGFRVYWEDIDGYSKLKYKEDILTGEHIWVERKNHKNVGNFIMQSDYKSGVYLRLADNEKSNVIKLE